MLTRRVVLAFLLSFLPWGKYRYCLGYFRELEPTKEHWRSFIVEFFPGGQARGEAMLKKNPHAPWFFYRPPNRPVKWDVKTERYVLC